MSLIDKVVQVVFRGKDDVTDAAKSAEGGVSGFASKAKAMLTGLAALGAGLAIGGFFKKAIEESLEASSELTRLGSAIDNTGVSFDSMKPRVLDTIQNLNRMSTFTQSDLRNALANMVTMTGNAEGSLKALGLATNLAAQRGIPLEQASIAIAKAMGGSDTALLKLMPTLKGSNDLFGDLEVAVRGAAEKMGNTMAGQIARAKDQFGEFANAVGDAILSTDGLTGGGSVLIDTLIKMQNWVAQNEDTIHELTRSLVELAVTIADQLGPAFQVIATKASPALKLVSTALLGLSEGVREIWAHIQNLAFTTEKSVGQMLRAFGNLVEKGGAMLKYVGIDVVQGVGKSMKDAGDDMVNKSQNTLMTLQWNYDKHQKEVAATWTRLWDDTKATSKKGGEDVVDGQASMTGKMLGVHKKSGEDLEREWQKQHKGMLTTFEQLNGLILKHEEILKTLTPALQKAYDRTHIDAANEATKRVKEETDAFVKATFEGQEVTSSSWERFRYKVKEAGFSIADAARTTIDFAQSFGVLDRTTASALNSIVNMGTAFGKLAGGDITAIPAVIGGFANVMSTVLQGDAERKRLLRVNNEALAKLSKDIGGLRLNVTGEDFEKLRNALSGVVPQLRNGRGAANENDVREALYAVGLTMADLDRVAKEFGIEVRSKSGALDVGAVNQLLQALGTTKLGRVGASFQDQLEFFKNSQRIEGNTGTAGGLSGFLDFLRGVGGVTALNGIDLSNPQKARDALRTLFTNLNNGTGVQGLGKLTGQQFADIILQIIDGIDALAPSPVAGSAPSSNSPGMTVPPAEGATGSGATGPTVQEILTEHSQAMQDVLTEHTALHTRVADATEGSLLELKTLNGKMDTLIAVTDAQIARVDTALATARRAASLSSGAAPQFT